MAERKTELPSSMAKKREESIINPFEEGLSTFGMNLASKGFSWAENLYQKWEDICQNNIIVQEPSKIVDAVGEHVRKLYEEVTDDWLNPFSTGCDKVQLSDFSLEQEVRANVSEESRISHGKGSINEGALICPMSSFPISSDEASKASIAPLPDTQRDERKGTCDLLNKNISFTPSEANGCSCSSEIRDNNEEVSDPSTSDSESLSLADEVSLSEFPKNMMEREFIASHLTNPTDACEESRTSHDEGSINEGALIFLMSGLAISSEEASIAPLPDIQRDERKETCDLINKNISFTPSETNGCSCSSETRDNDEEVPNLSINDSVSLPLADEISLSEFPENMMEREFMVSHLTDPTEEDGNSTLQEVSGYYTSEEAAPFVQPFSTVPEQGSSLSVLEASLSRMDIGSSDCLGDHKTGYSVAGDKTMETSEEFEDVSLEDLFEENKLKDSWKEAESYELALISYRAMKNRSYKKKLQDAFTSRFYSLKKRNEQGASFYGNIETYLAKIGIPSSSLDSSGVSEASNLLTLESFESDWELL